MSLLRWATTYKVKATDTRGERIRVVFDNGDRYTVGWDYGASDPHEQAVRDAVAVKSPSGTTYEIVRSPKGHPRTGWRFNLFPVMGDDDFVARLVAKMLENPLVTEVTIS